MKWAWAPIALVAFLSVQRSSRASAPSSPRTEPTAGGEGLSQVRSIASRIEERWGWTHLSDFLVAVAWTESRGNSQAGRWTGNLAVGWFGMRPNTALIGELGLTREDMRRPDVQVALAAYLAWRLRKYRDPGQTITWYDIRRGWALPVLVARSNANAPRSLEVLERWEKSIRDTGIPDISNARAIPPGFQWPGFDAVLETAQGGDT